MMRRRRGGGWRGQGDPSIMIPNQPVYRALVCVCTCMHACMQSYEIYSTLQDQPAVCGKVEIRGEDLQPIAVHLVVRGAILRHEERHGQKPLAVLFKARHTRAIIRREERLLATRVVREEYHQLGLLLHI